MRDPGFILTLSQTFTSVSHLRSSARRSNDSPTNFGTVLVDHLLRVQPYNKARGKVDLRGIVPDMNHFLPSTGCGSMAEDHVAISASFYSRRRAALERFWTVTGTVPGN